MIRAKQIWLISITKKNLKEATATGTVILSKKAINEIKKEKKISKGNVLNTARIAGIMAAKKLQI